MAVGSIVARILTQYSDKGTKQATKDIAKMEKKFGDFANKAAKSFGIAEQQQEPLQSRLGSMQ